MKDIHFDENLNELKAEDTTIYKAENLLRVQLGSKFYAPTWGMDFSTFFNPDIQIQQATFKSYTLERMAAVGVNVIELSTKQETFENIYNYTIKEAENRGLIV